MAVGIFRCEAHGFHQPGFGDVVPFHLHRNEGGVAGRPDVIRPKAAGSHILVERGFFAAEKMP